MNLVIDDNKRPDETTLLLWARGKPMAWDVTVPDTYADSHVSSTAVKPGAAAHRAAQSKTDEYSKLARTHFCPFAIETAGAWHETAVEVTQEIGRRITVVIEDTRKTDKNSSGDEIANVNLLTTISHTRRPTSKYRQRDKPTSFNKLDDRLASTAHEVLNFSICYIISTL